MLNPLVFTKTRSIKWLPIVRRANRRESVVTSLLLVPLSVYVLLVISENTRLWRRCATVQHWGWKTNIHPCCEWHSACSKTEIKIQEFFYLYLHLPLQTFYTAKWIYQVYLHVEKKLNNLISSFIFGVRPNIVEYCRIFIISLLSFFYDTRKAHYEQNDTLCN